MRILIIQLKRLGDLVLTTPVISALRPALPGAHLTLAAAGSAAELASLIDVDDRLFFGNGHADWAKLLRNKFDICLDFTGTDRSLLVAALARASRRITYQRFAGKPFRQWVYSDFVDSDVRHRHTADHHTDLLRPLGIERENVPSGLLEPTTTPEIPAPYAVIHAGTARSEKYWTASGWREVARWLANERGGRVVFTGGTNEVEQIHLREILAGSPPEFVNLAGKIRLPELAGVIQRAALLVSVDSVPVHLADALGTPVVALFGPTDPFHWRPRVAPNEIVKGKTMSAIRADEVIAAIGRLPAVHR